MSQAKEPRLLLASGSPRRAEILRRLGLSFEVRPPRLDEALRPDEPADAAAERLAREKAAARAVPNALTLACDTLVVDGAAILGKPADAEEAVDMLLALAGRSHLVHTGIALAEGGRLESAVETTRVWFRPLSRGECEEYVASGEPMDKAGAYGIQAYGSAVVARIEGDYFNVMGLPVQRLLELLGRFGWRYAFGRLIPADAEAERKPRASVRSSAPVEGEARSDARAGDP